MFVRTVSCIAALMSVPFVTGALADATTPPATPPEFTTVATPADPCAVGAVKPLIGQPFGTIDPLSVPGVIRILYPDLAPEPGVVPDRINVVVDKLDRIVSAHCG